MQNDKKTLTLSNDLLGNIERAMDESGYEMEWYLDLQKEQTIFLCDPDLTGEYEIMKELEEQLAQNDEGRFIPIPMTSSDEGWRMMEKFILSLDDQDENTRNLLLTNIQGRGAFERFKDAIYNIGLQDRWYEFKGRKERKKALDWLHSRDLITEEDIEKNMWLYEEQVAKRKQRQKEIAGMTKGVRLRCRENSGHEDKLTIGKAYDALDEQELHLNIRIRDDRGKLVWLPKNYFELSET